MANKWGLRCGDNWPETQFSDFTLFLENLKLYAYQSYC